MALTLPHGSTNISISETTPSSANYIALKAKQSQVFINGNFRVFHAGHTPVTFAMSLWSYERLSNGAESVKTVGPISEEVLVYLLASEVYDGISFSFNLPKSNMDGVNAPVYLWQALEWQSCDVDCGSGHQERNVTCEKLLPGGNLETQETDTMCVSLQKPITRQECRMDLCHYTWVVSEWNQCNVSCGGNGMESRTVTCQKSANSSTKVMTVDDKYCLQGRPTSARLCNKGECQYEWEYGTWGSCDSVCGEGWMEREVWCVREGEEGSVVSRSLCQDKDKPRHRLTCQSPAGSCSNYQWHTSEWSEVRGLLTSRAS